MPRDPGGGPHAPTTAVAQADSVFGRVEYDALVFACNLQLSRTSGANQPAPLRPVSGFRVRTP